jgi:hypothetical protein
MIFSMALESANRGPNPNEGVKCGQPSSPIPHRSPRRAAVAPRNLFQTIRFVTPLISAAKSRSPILELARLLVRLDHVAPTDLTHFGIFPWPSE